MANPRPATGRLSEARLQEIASSARLYGALAEESFADLLNEINNLRARLIAREADLGDIIQKLDDYDAECRRIFGGLPSHEGRVGAELMALIRRVEIANS